jgi:predicted AlkP superfamily phosphohydrolase/phosphomutase
VARRAVGATLTGRLAPFDWSKSVAFVGYQGDLWLNERGREPRGIVAPDARPQLLDQISHELGALEDPSSGDHVFARVYRREEIYSGPAFDMAPDLMLDSWSAGYRVAPGREPTDGTIVEPAALAGVDAPWSADHRPEGIFVAAGPHIVSGSAERLSLYDVCPTVLALLESAVPEGLDGRVVWEAIDEAFRERHGVRPGARLGERRGRGEYSQDEAAAVAAHLRALGYIE